MTDTKKKTASANPEEDGTAKERYDYLPAERPAVVRSTRDAGGPPSSVLNSAIYPATAKPEALHTEAEKDGAHFPLGDPGADDESVTGEKLLEQHREENKGLYAQFGELPGQVVKPDNVPGHPTTWTAQTDTSPSPKAEPTKAEQSEGTKA